MLIKAFIGSFLLVLTLACAKYDRSFVDSVALDRAHEISCQFWPLKKGELQAKILGHLQDAEGKDYYLTEVLLRNLKVRHTVSLLDEINAPKLSDLWETGWKSGVTYLSSMQLHSGIGILTISKDDLEQRKLQLYSFLDGKLLGESANLPPNQSDFLGFDGGHLGGFASYRIDDSNIPGERGLYRISFRNDKIDLAVIERKFANNLQLVTNEDIGVIAISKPENENTDELDYFVVAGTTSMQGRIPFRFSSKIESFSLAATKTKLFIGLVEGNSLIGGARLRIIFLNWNENRALELEGTQNFDLGYSHVGNPVWVDYDNYKLLVLPKWSDVESTLEVYKVENGKLEDLGSWGRFGEGTKFLLGLSSAWAEGPVFAISTIEEGVSEKLKLCSLSMKNLLTPHR